MHVARTTCWVLTIQSAAEKDMSLGKRQGGEETCTGLYCTDLYRKFTSSVCKMKKIHFMNRPVQPKAVVLQA